MTEKDPTHPDLNTLAIEACNMWQEQLSNYSKDPALRAELARFLEPQRRLFADWAAMMRQGGSDESKRSEAEPANGGDAKAESHGASGAATGKADPAASGVFAHDHDPFRIAQLALRVAELEKRVAQLESLSRAAG